MSDNIQQFDFPLIGALVGFLSLPLKFLVDVIRNNWENLPGKRVPIVGVIVGYILCLLAVAAAPWVSFSGPVFAECLLAAFMMEYAAMGVTEFQTKTNKVEEKIQLALNSPIGTSRQDIDNAVFGGTTIASK